MESRNNNLGMQQYELHEVRKACGIAACPSVYEVRKACMVSACPSVDVDSKDANMYYVVGAALSEEKIKDLGLAEKVGKGEVAMAVPKSLLEGLP